MTSWYIEVGGASGFSTQLDIGEQEAELRRVTLELVGHDRAAVIEEAVSAGMDPGQAAERAISATHDATARVVGTVKDRREALYVSLIASGGEPWRSVKEAYCRAFLRVLMSRMHRLGIDLNVTVS